MMYLISIITTLLLGSSDVNPVELGKVNWIRDYDKALELSASQNKPIFILFQEVPGCSTCKNYGNNVLSHPFIVEAIEDEFIPLAIFNNKGGKDKKVLEKYNEPTWNNPVVRIVDQNGENIIRRLYSNYSQQGVTEAMVDALLKSNKVVPNYLHLFSEELNANFGLLKESYVSMYCFWTGEKVIGGINGVTETEAGFMDGKEVVKFKYNPDIVDYEQIITKANRSNCADAAYTDDPNEKKIAKSITNTNSSETKKYRTDKMPKYYLSNTVYQYVPMSNYQSVKINSAIGKGESPIDLLSPRQIELLSAIEKDRSKNWEVVFREEFQTNWWKLYDNLSMKS